MQSPSHEIIHPICCDVPMWLVKVELGDWADHQHFECKVCDRTIELTMPVEQQRAVMAGFDP